MTALIMQPLQQSWWSSSRHDVRATRQYPVRQTTVQQSHRWRGVLGVAAFATIGVMALAVPWLAGNSLAPGRHGKDVIGLAGSIIGEEERVSEWQVAEPLGVNVRRANSVYSRQLTVIPYQEVVCGQKSGDWLALVGEPGFMLCETGHRQLLKKLETTQTIEQCRKRVLLRPTTTTATTVTATKTVTTGTTTTITVTTKTTTTPTSTRTSTTTTVLASSTTTTSTVSETMTSEAPNARIVDSLPNVSVSNSTNLSSGAANISSTPLGTNITELLSTTTGATALNASTLDSTTSVLDVTTKVRMTTTAAATSSSDSNTSVVTTSTSILNTPVAANASAATNGSKVETSNNASSINLTEHGSNSSTNETEVASDPSSAGQTTVTPEGQSIEEKRSQLEWQVYAKGVAHIRLARRPSAAVSGLVPEGGIILGTREGNWIKLFRRTGFFMVDKEGTVRALQREVSYSWLPQGSTRCAEFGKFPIEDPSVCEGAAVTLGLASSYTRLRKQSQLPEAGCYSDSAGVLWHSSRPSSNSSNATERRSFRPLCASRSYLATPDHAAG